VLLTADKSLAYQQNLRGRRIADAVNRAVPGSYFIVDVPGY
jgi:hypothetical protein